jgi:hypothetical protein
MSRYTTFARSLIKTAAALGSIALAAPALADPPAIYVFPFLRDDGSPANNGVATAVHCFNFGTAATLQFVVRNNVGTIISNVMQSANQFQTITVVTHTVEAFGSDLALNSGLVDRGVLGIASNSSNIACTAGVLAANSTNPNGIVLHGLRLNPIPGTEE